jgi:SWI/SNF-related matrix-associated actin-dependent regulator 1 of chromatin subfamily A
MKTASILNDNKIKLEFPFDTATIELVRDIDGRRWDKEHKYWTVPSSAWHCQRIISQLEPRGFEIDSRIRDKADANAKQPDLDYPVGIYPFQREAVDFITHAGGRVILADEMGLGKTIEALAYISLVSSKTLVISPSNVLYKWEAECKKWLPKKTVAVYPTGKGELGEEDIHVMSYGIMVSRFDQLKELEYDAIILDEAHLVKNSKAMRTRVTKALVKMGIAHVLFLSGTPFMNRPSELFPMLNMLDPVGFANYYTYAQRYCGAQYLGGAWYFPPNGATNLEELGERVKYLLLRRTKKDVLHDLPDLTRTSVPIEIDNIREYRKAVKSLKEWLKENDKEVLNPEHVLTRLNTLRQIVGQGKVQAAVELAESVLNDGKKVVLFCHHKEIVRQLQEAFKHYRVGTISGDVAPRKRQDLVNEFLKNSNDKLIPDSSLQVMIITVAGAEGIDLYSASDIIFVEREWTPAKEEQAESRLHRNGQKNPVNAWYIVASGTIDEKFDAMVRTKRAMFKKVIRTDEILELIMNEL